MRNWRPRGRDNPLPAAHPGFELLNVPAAAISRANGLVDSGGWLFFDTKPIHTGANEALALNKTLHRPIASYTNGHLE
jgi:hypothetical protein